VHPSELEQIFDSYSFDLKHAGEKAAKLGHRLVQLELRHERGALDAALKRLAVKSGISYRTWRDWWHWRSKPPAKGVRARTWNTLVSMYEAKIEEKLRAAEEELEKVKKLRRWFERMEWSRP
jgi:hypothetical protein